MSREAFQEPQAVAIKTAISSLLQARGDHATQEVLAQTSEGNASKRQPPVPPQCIEPEQTDAIDLGRDRGRLSPATPYDQTPACISVLSGSTAAGLPLAIR